MSELFIIDKWINIMLRTIRDQGLGPTFVARFQYLVSTILYYVYVCFNKAKLNCLAEKELQIIYLEEKELFYVDNMICVSMGYLYDLLNYDKKEINAQIPALNNRTQMVIDNIKQFLDRRNIDGWKIANIQPVFPNKNAFIDIESIQDLDKLLPEPHKWTPLKHKNGIVQKYLTPDWGNVASIENIEISKYINIADENYIDYDMKNGINELLSIYDNLNDNQRMIAEYFRGGQVSPPGMWNIWGLYTIHATNISALDATKFFYLLNSAMFVGSIACWNIKKKYMQARPIQEIRLLPERLVTNFDGTKVSNKIWKTFQPQNNQVPPFGSHNSGHSTFSSCASVIFDKFFPNAFSTLNFNIFSAEHGTMLSQLLSNNNAYPNTVKTIMIKINSSDVSHDTTKLRFPTSPIKLEFNSWRNLAELSGISRLYGGIHTNIENQTGMIIGEIIGRDVLNRAGL
jgi:hypothetical protein